MINQKMEKKDCQIDSYCGRSKNNSTDFTVFPRIKKEFIKLEGATKIL